MIGTIVADQYKILSRIGSGGMGEVYKAEDVRLKRKVAIKFLATEQIGKGTARSRFVREAQAASVLDHPNICTIHEISELEGEQLYIVMSFYDGQTLWDRMEEGPLPLLEAIEVTLGTLEGLGHAHERGVLHRDIKPANIMITDTGEVKLLDFGLARQRGQDRITREGTIVGTPAYMAPEQVVGKIGDSRTDLWAVGVVLYEMVSGRLPFEDKDDLDMINAIARGEAAPLGGLPTSELMVVGPIVSKTMARNPDERYQSAGAMADDIRRLRDQITGRIAPSAVGPRATAVDTERPPSVAVLPFDDLSPEKNQEYFCTGVAEELTTALGRLEGLRVASRLSASRLKEQGLDVKSLGNRLDVATILEGSVRKAGQRIRISAQLTEAGTGFQLWSGRFDRELDDVFAIQEEIAETIVETLRGRLEEEEHTAIVQRPTENPQAYTKYLRGRHLWNRRTVDSLRRGIHYFEEAIREDKGYAKAHAGIADSLVILGIYGTTPPREVMPDARSAAIKALQLDDSLAEAHTSLACIRAVFDWDWGQAEKSFKRAIELDADYATARQWLAMHCYLPQRRFDEAEAALQAAQLRDPLSPAVSASLGLLEHYRGRPNAAIDQLRVTLELDPSFALAHRFLGLAQAQQGHRPEAMATLKQAAELSPDKVEIEASIAVVQAGTGERDTARKTLQRLVAGARVRYLSSVMLAEIYCALGDHDRAMTALHLAHADRASDLIWVTVKPVFRGLDGDRRFQGLIENLGLATDPPPDPDPPAGDADAP